MMRPIFILSLLLMSYLGMAQKMDLSDCIKYAISNNLSYATTKIQLAQVKERYRQSKRNLLPSVGASISGSTSFGKSLDPNTNRYVNDVPIISSGAGLSASISLFDGFKKQNRVRYNKLQYLISAENSKQAKMNLAFKVMNSYFDLLYYTELLEIADEQVKLTNLNLKNTKRLIEIGLKAASDSLEMKAQQAREVYSRIKAHNEKEIALLNLKKLMNFPLQNKLNISKDVLLTIGEYNYSVDSIYQEASKHMPLLKKAVFDLQASKKNLAISRGSLYPTLSLNGGISSSYSDYNKITFREQVSNNISKSISLSLSIPIFEGWANRSAIRNAKYNLEISQNQLEDTKRKLFQEITQEFQALQALKEEKKQLGIKQKAMQVAYRIAEKKLEQGLINIIDFYKSKTELASTDAELLRIKFQVIIKQKTIDFYLDKVWY